MKLSLKINLLFALIVSGILLAMSIIIYNVSRQNVRNDFEHRLENWAARTAYLYKVFRNDTANLLPSLHTSAPPQLFNKSILVYGVNNKILYAFHDNEKTAFIPGIEWLETAEKKGVSFYVVDKKDICVYHNSASIDLFTVVVAAENLPGREYINDLEQIFLIFLPLALLVTLVAGYIFSRKIITPIKETIHDAKLITSQNLSQRLFVGKNKDELAELNATFNDLLNRLEESFSIQRRFISNASHELSTPLTSVSSQIEVALLQDRSTQQYQQVLSSVLEDIKVMHQLTKTLLEIAKAGTHGTISLDKIRLDEVLVKAHSEVLRQNPDFNIGLEFTDLPEDESECMVFGNTLLLQSAFKNIMENGCKYSPDKNVEVNLHFNRQEIELVFKNKSDSLSAEELGRLFEPFYRSSNSDGKPGFGLGLTLTRRIIRLHKGELTASSEEDGTVFRIVLPALRK